jgi:hypothetical protein
VVDDALGNVSPALPSSLVQLIEEYCLDIIVGTVAGNLERLPTYLSKKIRYVASDGTMPKGAILVSYLPSYTMMSMILPSPDPRSIYMLNRYGQDRYEAFSLRKY